ncbi:MAG TPA: hypothetical protein VN794_21540 [Methylomirabilota bacterium]|nr:hypothetical protein [Methylomirabilota bacterium]
MDRAHVPDRSLAPWILGTLPCLLWVLFIGALVPVVLGLWLPRLSVPYWLDAAVALLGLAVTLTALSRQLPFQNVLAATFILFCLERAPVSPGKLAGLDLQLNPGVQKAFPWIYPAVCAVVILSSRGLARLLLRPTLPRYPISFVGLVVLLSTFFALGFEPFATHIRGYYNWPPSRAAGQWFGVPWYGFLAHAAVSALGLLAATPFLISKRPAPIKDSFQPVAVWILLNLLSLSGAIADRLWPAACVILVGNLLLPALALGTRRQR